MLSKYIDLSNKPYLRTLPDLTKLNHNIETLRLTALYLHNIDAIGSLNRLKKLNISFTYVKSLPVLPLLEELSMVEVDLNNYDDLAKFGNLKKLKITHDDINLTMPLNSIEILHCAVLHRPDLLFFRFPNLKELRFEHIHPKNPNNIINIDYYEKLIYKKVQSTKTIIQLKNPTIIDDFDDEVDLSFNDFELKDYIEDFASNRLEYLYYCKDLSHMKKHNIYTIRTGEQMNIHDNDGVIIKSFERNTKLSSGNRIIETISDEEYIRLMEYQDNYSIDYSKKDDQYNKTSNKDIQSQYNIIKSIIQNNYKLNDEIINLMSNFSIEGDDLFGQTIMDIKINGLTDDSIEKIRWVDGRSEYDIAEDNGIEYINKKEKDDSEDDDTLLSSSIRNYYDKLDGNMELHNLTVDEIKDILWYRGKQYLLSNTEKQKFVDKIKEINDEWNQDKAYFKKHARFARFTEDGIVHYKIDENGNEIPCSDNEISDDENDGKPIDENCLSDTSDEIFCLDPKSVLKKNVIIKHAQIDCNIANTSTENDISDSLKKDSMIKHSGGTDVSNELISSNDNSNEETDDMPKNVVYKVQWPGNDFRQTYNPNIGYPNNVFLDNGLIVMDDNNIDVIEKPLMENNIMDRQYLNFYGKPANLSTLLMKNSNGYIMMGTSHDSDRYEYMDALLDKQFQDKKLSLRETFFMFKNRMYTNFMGSDTNITDYTDDIVVLNDGRVGWGGTFYAFDVILNPHPNLITEKDIIIQSPLNKTLYHNHIHKCCMDKITV